MDLVIRETKRCAAIIKRLLDFAREKQPEKKFTDLNQVIDDTVRIVEKPAHLRDIEITRRPRPDAAADLDRRRSDQAGGHEHAGQRPARGRGEGQHHRHHPPGARTPRAAATEHRADGGNIDRRYRLRHSGKEPEADIRPVFHLQGRGQGNRIGTFRQPRHRRGPWRPHRGAKQGGRGIDVPRLSAADAAAGRAREQSQRERSHERANSDRRRRGNRHQKLPAHSRRRRIPGRGRAGRPRGAAQDRGKSLRRDDPRHHDAQHRRPRSAAPGQGDASQRRRHHDHRPVADRHRRAGHEARRLRLSLQAVRAGRIETGGAARAGAAPAAAGESHPQERGLVEIPLREHRRLEPADAGRLPADRAMRADQFDRADHRRKRHRQGTDRARDPLQQSAQGQAVRSRSTAMP